MDVFPKTLTGAIGRLGAAAQNALEVARFGGLDTDEQPSPYEVVAEHRVYRLRRYYHSSRGDGEAAARDGEAAARDGEAAARDGEAAARDGEAAAREGEAAAREGEAAARDGEAAADGDGRASAGPAVLLVPPMMLAAEIYDVSPATSAVTLLHEHGVDPWVVDFGAPEREEGGLERTLADHVLAVSDAVDRVREATGRDVHLGGYSQGGMFCYQVAAYRRNAGLGSLVTFGSPVDTRLGMPFGLPEELASGLAGLIADVFRSSALPAWFSRNGFILLDPVKSIRSRIEFVMQLHDREALLPREGQRRFLEGDGWVAWPGPALAEFVGQFVAHNRMLEGGFVIDERLLSLADIRCPILSVVGTVDELAPAAGVRAIRQAAPRADVYELALRAGHFGLVVGSTSNQVTWPTVAAWAQWRDGGGELPEAVTEVPDEPAQDLLAQRDRIQNRVGYGLELAGAVSSGIARSMVGGVRRTTRSMRELAREAAGSLPQLARLEQIQPSTRVSLGLLVEERMQRAADETMFLYEDRAYSASEVNQRIDNVVRGLISIGVRQGEHVGVLMGSRPSALAVVTALSRLGAVAVMLRPDGNTAREASLGAARRIIADPERAPQAAGLGTVHTFVLGGGGGPREFQLPLTTDMERIDPRAVALPAWYRPNPGRASDLAFILFTGEGDYVRMSRITNRRWAASAFGTASSAALSGADTVYSVTPLYHPSGLMMSIGGAIAGGARVAMASQFDPTTFWDEARRYGVTVASYTWTLLHDLVVAPPDSGERGHPVRLFIGSGMPRGLWRRVQARFAPARVVEFYASTETGAILVNLRDAKAGAMGRRLPGTPEVRIAAYDQEAEQLILGRDGFVRRCETDEVGLLVARARPGDNSVTPMRGVFSRDDAWLSTGDLFRRDADGDYWRLDGVYDVIHTAAGPVLAAPIRDALGDLPAVDLAIAYGLRPSEGAEELAVGAVTLCPGHTLSSETLSGALAELPEGHGPSVVHVIDEMPVTTWFRPRTRPLRQAGLPEPAEGRAWYLDRGGRRYQPLTDAARRRLAAAGRGGRQPARQAGSDSPE